MKTLLVGATAVALLASTAPAMAAPVTSDPVPIPLVSSGKYPVVQPGETRTGTMSPTPPMNLAVQQDEIARAGGRGSVLIPIVREDTGQRLRDVRVRVTTAKGTRIIRIAAKGWKCTTPGNGAICSLPSLAAGLNPSPLYAVIAVNRGYSKPAAKVTARSTWKGSTVRHSASSTRLQVYRPFTVRLAGPPTRALLTTNTTASHRQFSLSARINRLDGGQADARWTQISGPRTRFVLPARVKGVRDQAGQVVRVPNAARGNQTYRFALTVDANGQVVRKTVTVRARINRSLGKVGANNAALTELAAASRKPDKTRTLHVSVSNGVRLKAKPGFSVLPGQAVRVRVATTRKVASIAWFEGKTALGTGRSIRVKAPVATYASRVIKAHVTLRDGTGLLESALLRSTTDRPSVGTDPTDASKKAFCTVADSAKKALPTTTTVKLGDTYTLDLTNRNVTEDKDVRDAKKNCTGSGTLTFEKATLKRGNTEVLTAVSGTITATDGVAMQGATWPIPAPLQPAKSTLGSIDLEAKDRPVLAKLDDGTWTLPDGTFKIKPFKVGNMYGLAFVPLPDVGWQFDPENSLLSFVNKSVDEPLTKDATIRFSQQAKGPEDATAAFTVDTTDGQWQTAKIEAANISLGQTADGDTISASGSGTLPLAKGSAAGVELSIQCLHDGQASATCELAKNFAVKDFTLKWNRDGLGILGEAAVRYGDPATSYEFGVTGAYNGSKNWSLAVLSAQPWALGDTGLSLAKLAGSLGMKPLPADEKKSQFFIQLTAAVQGFTVDSTVTVKQVSGAITNLCPVDVTDCDPGEVRVALSTDLAAHLPKRKDPVSLHANSYVNLTKMTFEFDFGFEEVQIGPDQLNVNKAQFILSNEDTEQCKPQGAHAPAVADNVYSLQIIAQAKVLGANLTAGGTVQGNGYCLWGIPEAIDAGKAGETTSQVFGYTNYPNGADLRLPTGEDKILQPNIMQVVGTFNLPKAVDDAFGIDGDVDYVAALALQNNAVSMKLTYTPKGEVSIYKSGTANLTLKDVSFALSSATGEYKLDLDADAELFMKGGSGTPDSVTPFYANAGFEFGEQTKAIFGLGVDTTDGPVTNAFGQAGLTVNTLAVNFTMSLPKPSANLAFAGDVILPQSWVGSIGIKNGTREALSFSLGAANWCVAIEIGQESTAYTQIAVDVANRGFLKAGYFKLVIAPEGCEVPIGKDTTKQIAPGFGFAFIGQIVGAPLIATLDANWKDGLVAKGKIEVPYLDMYAVRLGGSQQGTPAKVDFDIDSKAGKYDVAFDVGLAIGAPERNIGAYVAVKGFLKTSDPDFIDFDFRGSGGLALGPVGVTVETLGLSGHIAKGAAKARENTLAADATLVAKVLGIGLRASGGLRYEHQQLVEFQIALGMSLNFVVGAVSGNLEFNYCLGSLTDLQADGSGSKCTPYANYVDAAPAYRVGFFGSYRILWWSHGYTWTAFDQRGREGSAPPPAPANEPAEVPGKIPPAVQQAQVFSGVLEDNADMKWTVKQFMTSYDISFKTARGQEVDGAPACKSAVLGTEWAAADTNPKAENVNPDPGDGSCGLAVYVYDPNRSSNVDEIAVKCTPFECTAANGEFAGKALALDGADGKQRRQGRDKLLAGLRSPLGVQPAGTRIDQKVELQSPDTALRLQVYADVVRLYNMVSEKAVWRATTSGTPIAAVQFAKSGVLQAMDAKGNVLFTVGKQAPLDPDVNPVYLHITKDGLRVRQVASGVARDVWGIGGYSGSCDPDPSVCEPRKAE